MAVNKHYAKFTLRTPKLQVLAKTLILVIMANLIKNNKKKSLFVTNACHH